jgi:hypothetical protein
MCQIKIESLKVGFLCSKSSCVRMSWQNRFALPDGLYWYKWRYRNMASMNTSLPDKVLEALLLEGLNSGEVIPFSKNTIDEVRQRLSERLVHKDK